MGLSIRNPRARELARKLAERRGCSLTEVVVAALEREAALEEARVQEKLRRTREVARHFESLLDLRPGFTDADPYDDEGQPVL